MKITSNDPAALPTYSSTCAGHEADIQSTFPRSLKGHRLSKVINDTPNLLTCGPMAVASITGAPASVVMDAFRVSRYGSLELAKCMPEITGTSANEMCDALTLLGFECYWEAVTGPKNLKEFVNVVKVRRPSYPWVVMFKDDIAAITEDEICDCHTFGQVERIPNSCSPSRRKKVRAALQLKWRKAVSAKLDRTCRLQDVEASARQASEKLSAMVE